MAALNDQSKVGTGYPNIEESQNSNQKSLTHVDLWHSLTDLGEIGMKPIKFLFNLYKQKISRSSEQKSSLNHKKRVMIPQSIPRLDPVYRTRTP